MVFGVGLGMRAVIMTILTVAFADLSPDVSTGLAMVKWLAAGGAIGLACQLLPPHGPRFPSQRKAVAALYDALAADARAYAADGTAHQPSSGPLLTARQALVVLPQFARPGAAALFGLTGEAERIARYLFALQGSAEIEPRTRETCCTAAAEALSEIAAAVRSGRPVAGAADRSSPAPVPARSEDRPGARALQGLSGALAEARLLSTAWVSYLGTGGTSAWSRTIDTVIGSAIAMAVYLLWPTWHGSRLPGLLGNWIRAEGRRLGALATAWSDPASAVPAALERVGHQARVARRQFEEAAAHAGPEPDRHRGPWSEPELHELSRSVHQLGACSALLTAHLPGPERPGVPSVARYAESVQQVLSELAAAAESGALPDPAAITRLNGASEAHSPDTPEVFAHVARAVEDLAATLG